MRVSRRKVVEYRYDISMNKEEVNLLLTALSGYLTMSKVRDIDYNNTVYLAETLSETVTRMEGE